MTPSKTRLWAAAAALAALLCHAAPASADLYQELSGYISGEFRFFPDEPLDPRQFDDVNLSIAAQPEYFLEWDSGTQRVVIVPFLRIDQNDDQRTHFDLREAYYEKVWRVLELRAGVRKIFWGVVESNHLVDVINQIDGVENFDGEDRLGQPMVDVAVVTSYGVFEAYAMPYFRERTFPGVNGRLRTVPRVDVDNPIYESDDEEWHFDWALRYSHYFSVFDFAIAHFQGTSRQPQFILSETDEGETVLLPFYGLMDQTSIELQATTGPALWKFEGLTNLGVDPRFWAGVAGIEYTFFTVFGSDIDLGVLAEYHYDDRDNFQIVAFQDDGFLGARLAFNDVQDTQLLGGVIKDFDVSSTLAFVEGSRRIGNNWRLEVEYRGFHRLNPNDVLYFLRQDTYLQADLAWFF